MKIQGSITDLQTAEGGWNVQVDGHPDSVFVPEGIVTSGPALEIGQVVTIEVEEGSATSISQAAASSEANPVKSEGDDGNGGEAQQG